MSIKKSTSVSAVPSLGLAVTVTAADPGIKSPHGVTSARLSARDSGDEGKKKGKKDAHGEALESARLYACPSSSTSSYDLDL